MSTRGTLVALLVALAMTYVAFNAYYDTPASGFLLSLRAIFP
jgi:hypothetical protein